ncbi:MAG: DUF4116 domain-containing protein [Candidatus Moranbacteria bacterium]|nr:DUF4116 domain-containing protein [Candidatus Moranbacteria bacterium]
MRGVLTLEQGQAKKVFKLLQDGLENLVAQNLIPTSVAKQFRQLRAKILKGEKKMIFNRLNFDGCGAEYEDKNRDFFGTLYGANGISYERRSMDRDTYYDLLWVNRDTDEENCIPVPVFLQIIGEDTGMPRLQIIELLQQNHLEVKREEPKGAIPDEDFDDVGKMREWIEKDPGNIYFAPAVLKDDKELVLLVIRRSGFLSEDGCTFTFDFQYFSRLSDRLKDDHDVVLAAVSGDSHNFEYASERLRGNREIALAAMKQSTGGFMMQYVAPELWTDREVLFAALATYGQIYSYDSFPAELRNDPKVTAAAIKGAWEKWRETIATVPAEIKKLPEIQMAITSHEGDYNNIFELVWSMNSKTADTKATQRPDGVYEVEEPDGNKLRMRVGKS